MLRYIGVKALPIVIYLYTCMCRSRKNEVGSITCTSYRENSTFFTSDILLALSNLFISFNISLILIYLSGDIELNPGPINNYQNLNSFSSSAENLNTENSVSFVHLNVQSLLPKLDIIEAELFNIKILSFTETWLNENDITPDIDLPYYQPPFCKCRKNQHGGGVAVYVHENIMAKRRVDLEMPSVESVWLELHISGKRYLYGTFYRPPNAPTSLWDQIEYSFDLAFNTQVKNIIITGDFNVNQLKQNAQLPHLQNIIRNYGLIQLIHEPTHFTKNSSSIIDLILVNDDSLIKKSYVGDCFLQQPIRYHCPIFGVLNLVKNTYTFKRHIWLFKKGNFDLYREKLNSVDWDETFRDSDINTCVNRLNDLILINAKSSIPNKTITVRQNDPPRLTSSI